MSTPHWRDVAGPGPWDDEPDSDAWVGLGGWQCAAIRHPRFGNWLGYVRVPRQHRWEGLGYDDEQLQHVQCHGGLTFAGHRDDERWWLGFDCAHAGDLVPGLGTFEGDAYRDLDYVHKMCDAIIFQAVWQGPLPGP